MEFQITENLLLSNEKYMFAYNLAHNEYASKGKQNMIKSGIDNEELRLATGGQFSNTEESKIMICIYNQAITDLYFLTK